MKCNFKSETIECVSINILFLLASDLSSDLYILSVLGHFVQLKKQDSQLQT